MFVFHLTSCFMCTVLVGTDIQVLSGVAHIYSHSFSILSVLKLIKVFFKCIIKTCSSKMFFFQRRSINLNLIWYQSFFLQCTLIKIYGSSFLLFFISQTIIYGGTKQLFFLSVV